MLRKTALTAFCDVLYFPGAQQAGRAGEKGWHHLHLLINEELSRATAPWHRNWASLVSLHRAGHLAPLCVNVCWIAFKSGA